MTHFITALSNDRARFIHKEAQTTCEDTAQMIAAKWVADGFHVVRKSEGLRDWPEPDPPASAWRSGSPRSGA